MLGYIHKAYDCWYDAKCVCVFSSMFLHTNFLLKQITDLNLKASLSIETAHAQAPKTYRTYKMSGTLGA